MWSVLLVLVAAVERAELATLVVPQSLHYITFHKHGLALAMLLYQLASQLNHDKMEGVWLAL